MSAIQNETKSLITSRGKRYFSLINPCLDKSSIFNLINKSSNLKKYLLGLADLRYSKNFSDSELLSVLRVVTGKKSNSQSMKFHYDASVITVLVPILIPNGAIEDSGHLVAFKNLRNVRTNAIFNFIEKIFVQNPLSRKITSFLALKNLNNVLHKIEEGNIYFFYGYRTLHANLPVNPAYKRATLLLHFGDPHRESKLIKLIVKVRKWRERKNLEKS